VNEFSVSGLRALVESTAADFEPGVLGLSTVEATVSHWGAIERIACAAKLRAAARAEDWGWMRMRRLLSRRG
jgi:hypothetical protein